MALMNCKECGNEVSTKAKTCPKCGAKVKSDSFGCGSLIIVLIALSIIGSLFSSKNDSTLTSASNQPNPSDVKRQVKEQVKIKKLNWNKGGFDNIMMIDATFENKSNKDIKDIEVTCNHFSNSGTKIDSNSKVIYETIKAGKSKSVHDFSMGFIHSQAASTNCSISDLVVK